MICCGGYIERSFLSQTIPFLSDGRAQIQTTQHQYKDFKFAKVTLAHYRFRIVIKMHAQTISAPIDAGCNCTCVSPRFAARLSFDVSTNALTQLSERLFSPTAAEAAAAAAAMAVAPRAAATVVAGTRDEKISVIGSEPLW